MTEHMFFEEQDKEHKGFKSVHGDTRFLRRIAGVVRVVLYTMPCIQVFKCPRTGAELRQFYG